MEQFTIRNLTVRVSEDFNYIWVLLDEFTKSDEFVAALRDSEFLSQLMLRRVKNILLDCGKMLVLSIPDMPEFLDTEFADMMQACGVEKVSIIINEEVFSIMQGFLTPIEDKHRASVPQIRFFDRTSFYNSFESVSWF